MVASSDAIAFATLFRQTAALPSQRKAAVRRKSVVNLMASLEATIYGAAEVVTRRLRRATNTGAP